MAIVESEGVYDLPADVYHQLCTPEPALSSTGARELTAECPAFYWWNSGQLNPEYRQPEKRHFDIGTAVHLLALEPEDYARRIFVITATDYRTTEARDARAQARKLKRIPLLAAEEEAVVAMRHALREHPIARYVFDRRHNEAVPALIERSMFWKDRETGIWCKSRPDFLPVSREYVVDLKTSTTANPTDFERSIAEWGYHQQAAWYLDGVEAVYGFRPARFGFIVVGKPRPHLVSVCWLSADALAWGEILNRKARAVFAKCLKTGEWPGYQHPMTETYAAFEVGLPAWKVRDLRDRLERGQFDPKAMEPTLAAGVAAQAPLLLEDSAE